MSTVSDSTPTGSIIVSPNLTTDPLVVICLMLQSNTTYMINYHLLLTMVMLTNCHTTGNLEIPSQGRVQATVSEGNSDLPNAQGTVQSGFLGQLLPKKTQNP